MLCIKKYNAIDAFEKVSGVFARITNGCDQRRK